MTITPQGQLYLCRTPLENDYKNQLTFDTPADQLNYFTSKVKYNLASENYTYIKKDNSINVGLAIDDIIDCNYLFYRNVGFTTKNYYCFITNMEYVNENCTRITFETDCYQTWMFDLIFNPCFIEREHVENDGFKFNRVPENLDTGEYIVYHTTSSQIGEGTVCIASTYDLFNSKSAGSVINGIFQGVDYYVFRENTIGDLETNVNAFLTRYAQAGRSSAITSMFIVPKKMIDYEHISWDTIPDTEYKYKKLAHSSTPFSFPDIEVNYDYTKIHNITPKNNKLLQFPYRYYMISNNNGANVILREEFFNNTNPAIALFKVYGDITPGCSIKLVPQNYKNITENIEEGINGGKFPICSWDTDVYTNWLTQNAVNIGLSLAGGVIDTASGIYGTVTNKDLTSKQKRNGIVGESVSGLFQIANVMANIYQHSLIPPQAEGNLNAGDVTYSLGKNEFTIYEMGITDEYIYRIDNYFSMFGYKVNEIKIPNLKSRTNWNYIKTIDCNFDGNIPQDDLNIIKTMFNNGVTLWHNPATIFDYSQTNTIVTP